MTNAEAELLRWCERERDAALGGLDGIKNRGLRLMRQELGGPVVDCTDAHKADLERIARAMDDMIAKLSAHKI